MAIDRKYGRVTLEHGTIGEDEPVVVFRAQDRLLPELLLHYAAMCARAGSPSRHIAITLANVTTVAEWQESSHAQVPNSESSRAWLPETTP
jgi:hypothetical protein